MVLTFGRYHPARLPRHQTQHVRAFRAQRHPDSDFRGSQRHTVPDYRVQSERRKQPPR